MGIKISPVQIAGPAHPSFGANKMWYTFGMFSENGIVRLFLVEAENGPAVHMIESLVQENGSVSNTCGLISSSPAEPLVRSASIERLDFVDFVVDIVDPSRWLDSPFLIETFRQSLSDVDVILAGMKIDLIIRQYEFEKEQKLQQEYDEIECEPGISPEKAAQLQAGLVGLGFQKSAVEKFVSSLDGEQTMEDMMKAGICCLSGRKQ